MIEPTPHFFLICPMVNSRACPRARSALSVSAEAPSPRGGGPPSARGRVGSAGWEASAVFIFDIDLHSFSTYLHPRPRMEASTVLGSGSGGPSCPCPRPRREDDLHLLLEL